MSLAQAVEEIAQFLEEDGQKAYAKMLRIALKASEGEAKAAPMEQIPAALHHRLAIEAAKDGMKKEKRNVEGEEGYFGKQTELVGGPDWDPKVPMFVENANDMPVGAKRFAHDGIYELRKDGKLHYCPGDTIRHKENTATSNGNGIAGGSGIVLG